MYLNRYGLSHLNSWDGNSIKISEEEGYILSPQVGAGRKETDGTFTGMLMGEVKGGQSEDKVGLMGYGHGIQTMFLDAETGSAYFGKGGEISIKPQGEDTEIKLGPWFVENSALWKGSNIIGTQNGIYLGDNGFSLGSQLVYNQADLQLTVKGTIDIGDDASTVTGSGVGESNEDNPDQIGSGDDSSDQDNESGTEDEETGVSNPNQSADIFPDEPTPSNFTYDTCKIQTYYKKENVHLGAYLSPNILVLRSEKQDYPTYNSGYITYIPGIKDYRDKYKNDDGKEVTKGVNHFFFSRPICATSFRLAPAGIRIISYAKQKESKAASSSLYPEKSTSFGIVFGPSREDCEAKTYEDYNRPRRTYLRGDRVLIHAFGTQHAAKYNNSSNKTYYGQILLYGRQTRVYNYGKKPYTSKSWTTSSDERAKNIQPLNEKYYDFFKKLQPCAYTWKNEEDGPLNIGYSAQQVKQALFDSGLELKDFGGLSIEYDEEMYKQYGIKDFHSLSYEEFGPIYAAVLQRALNKIDELEERIKELEK
jgi:hypothetical protein